jgi:L-alanine-DL-glutamate epimerase-like enolase superfamily enzyme
MLQITLHSLRIPFRTSFKHAAATRTETQSLWVEARSRDGIVGYGESCPREYVTGESLESSKEFFSKCLTSIVASIRDLASLKSWSESHRAEIDRQPAAWCAIELALLDLFAKQAKATVEEYLGLPPLEGPFRYTAVLGDSDLRVFRHQLERYRAMGFSDYKIKVSGDIDRDKEKLEAVVATGASPDRIRLDANNLWKQSKEATQHLKQLSGTFHAVEEPVAANDYAGMSDIARSLNVRIVLDESFSRLEHFENLQPLPGPWILNLRVSKMGGLLRSLAIVDRARDSRVPVIVGAQVGETSLLTRAALTIANQSRGLLAGQEGAFGTLLLETDICQPVLMFGRKGELPLESSWHSLPGFGLDVTPLTSHLQKLT